MSPTNDSTLDRVKRNAESLMDQFQRSEDLLRTAMQEATPWVMKLVTRGAVPTVYNIETLATKLIAIVMATDRANKDIQNG